jgi:hypothetical protein
MPTRKTPAKPAKRAQAAPKQPALVRTARAAPTPPPARAPPPRKPPARYQPTDADRNVVKRMVAAGVPQETILLALGLGSRQTLRKYYAREIDTYAAVVIAQVAGMIIDEAVNKRSVDAGKFYLSRRGGPAWKEKVVVEDGGTAPDADLSNMSDADIEARIARLRRTAAVSRFVKQNTGPIQ